jgi:hypothetical protein
VRNNITRDRNNAQQLELVTVGTYSQHLVTYSLCLRFLVSPQLLLSVLTVIEVIDHMNRDSIIRQNPFYLPTIIVRRRADHQLVRTDYEYKSHIWIIPFLHLQAHNAKPRVDISDQVVHKTGSILIQTSLRQCNWLWFWHGLTCQRLHTERRSGTERKIFSPNRRMTWRSKGNDSSESSEKVEIAKEIDTEIATQRQRTGTRK